MEIRLQVVLALLLEVVQAKDCVSGVRQEKFFGELLRILVRRSALDGVLDDWLDRW